MFHMIASFPGSCVGRHEPRNEANHMIDFKKSHQHNYVLVCVCVCVCMGGRGTHSLASNNLRRGRRGLVTLQPSSCHNRNLM